MKAESRSPMSHENPKGRRIPDSRRRGECILPFHDPSARLAREFTVPHLSMSGRTGTPTLERSV